MLQKLSLPRATPAIGIRSAASTSWERPLPMPRPRTPPRYPDIHGRRRMAAEFDLLAKEISLLEGELELLEGFCPASMCCKEVLEFTESKSDPLLDLRMHRDRIGILLPSTGKELILIRATELLAFMYSQSQKGGSLLFVTVEEIELLNVACQ